MRRFVMPSSLIRKQKPSMYFRRLRQAGLAFVTTAVISVSSLAPANAAVSTTWTVKPGDTLWSIAKANQLSLTALESANPNVNPLNLQIGTSLEIPSASQSMVNGLHPQTYTIQAGDTFWLVAKRFGLSMNQLMSANPNLDPANLTPGAVIVIPNAPAPVSNVSTATSLSSNSLSSNPTSSTDLYWLAHVIHAEANGLSLQAQVAVGDVVLHRVQSPDYPDTIQGVIFEVTNGHYQFTCVANGYIYSQPDAGAYQAAQEVLQQHVDVVPGAFVFYNPTKTSVSSWVWQQTTVSTIGPFVFAK